MKTDQMKPLSEIEWTTCWMAIRYAMGRCSAASASLPRELLETYFYRWTDTQKRVIVRELRNHLEDVKRWYNTDEAYFGDKDIDHPIWMRFLLTLDRSTHVEVTLENGCKVEAFEYEDEFYPVYWFDGPDLRHMNPYSINAFPGYWRGGISIRPIAPVTIINIQKLNDYDK